MTRTEKADAADVVFTGRVRTVRHTADGLEVARFRVRILYKGSVRRDVNVSTAQDEATCGFQFHVGRRYTVFAHRDDGLRTDICTGTKRGPIDPDRFGLPDGRRV